MTKSLLIMVLLLAVGCASERGGVASRTGVTTGQGSKIETGLDMNIGPNAEETSPSVRERNLEKPKVEQPFADDPATISPSK